MKRYTRDNGEKLARYKEFYKEDIKQIIYFLINYIPMDKFIQYKLEITDKEKKLVEDYLSKMKEIVDKYDIDKELYNDIEERLFEKLSALKNLNQLNITKILKEM
jgi:hypothetical protein